MLRILLLLLAFSTTPAWGSDYGLNLEHFDMKFGKFLDNRDPYVPEYAIDAWEYRIEMNLCFNWAGIVYFDQRPHFEAVNSTPKTVGWQYELGIHLTDQIDIYHDHHSRHVMEEYRSRIDGHNPFPVEDLYGVKFTIVDQPGNRRGLSEALFGH